MDANRSRVRLHCGLAVEVRVLLEEPRNLLGVVLEIALSVTCRRYELEQMGVAVASRPQRDHAYRYPRRKSLREVVVVVAGLLGVRCVGEEDYVLHCGLRPGELPYAGHQPLLDENAAALGLY